jgi:hypothetical protein
MEDFKNKFLNMRMIVITSCFLVVLVSIILIIIFYRNSSEKPSDPTVPNSIQEIEIVDYSPKDKSRTSSIFTPISVTFSTNIPSSSHQLFSVQLTPRTAGTTSWVNNNTLRFTPNTPLLSNTTYQVNVLYGNKEYAWSFSTPKPEDVPLEDKNKSQIEADRRYSELQENTLEKYPWLSQLPLQTAQYFVYFDTNKKQFIAKIYPSEQQTSQEIQSLIVSELQRIGASNTENIDWQIQN